ncbi:hypothetical protein Tco_0584812, partial [Tanacetum coccineum]
MMGTARGGEWGGRSDRSGGGESFGTWPENSPEKFSSGRRWWRWWGSSLEKMGEMEV